MRDALVAFATRRTLTSATLICSTIAAGRWRRSAWSVAHALAPRMLR